MDGSALAHADDSGSQFSLRQFGDCGAETWWVKVFHGLFDWIERTDADGSFFNEGQLFLFKDFVELGFALESDQRLECLFKWFGEVDIQKINGFHDLSDAQVELFFDLLIVLFSFDFKWDFVKSLIDLFWVIEFRETEIVEEKIDSAYHWDLLASYLLDYFQGVFLPSLKSLGIWIDAGPLYTFEKFWL
jgi:hypothetical protein